jgi:hypothetical protein
MPTVNEISLKYREQFLKNQATFERQFKGVFDKVAQDISRLANDPQAKFTKAFNFSKPIKVKIDGIMQNFQNQTLGLTEKMISDSWDISNSKNDEIVKSYLSTVTGLKTVETASYFLPNTSALEAFISRANNATTLADTVWNISKQARAEMETHLGIGIVNGDSANVISQRIRQYLQNPQALFRRVRDKNGKLIASQAMRENKPGQGVYNSAFKNAMRVARTETNQAYLLSDNLRSQQHDLVLGVRISLSDQHKIVDICDDLIGDYPKYFVWVGWHPQDLCNATPILMPKADFQEYLESGGKLPKGKQITEMPENFKEYMKANIDRFEGYKSQPYFMTDNKAIIDGIVKGGVKNVVSPIAGIVEQAVKTEFVAAKSIQEAEQRINSVGVKYFNSKGFSLDHANASLRALESIPSKAIPDALGNGKAFQDFTKSALGRKANQWYGISVEYPDLYKEGRSVLKFGEERGWFKVVGINSREYPTIESITIKKLQINETYNKKFGKNYFFNTNGELTHFHEYGHIYKKESYGQAFKTEWDQLSRKWYFEAKCDVLKSESEAFAEAFADYFGNDAKRLPEYIKDFFIKNVK